MNQLNNSQIHEQTNTRIYNRNIPSQPLQPYLDARPVLTKYSIMPIVDPRAQINIPLIQRATYTSETVFSPGNVGPWSGYASNVNHESELHNQIFALQSCSQSTYIPSSKSNLYEVSWKNQTQLSQPFPNLFKTENFSPTCTNSETNKIGYALFNNSTRHQLKDLSN
jgi:hypothetical protein